MNAIEGWSNRTQRFALAERRKAAAARFANPYHGEDGLFAPKGGAGGGGGGSGDPDATTDAGYEVADALYAADQRELGNRVTETVNLFEIGIADSSPGQIRSAGQQMHELAVPLREAGLADLGSRAHEIGNEMLGHVEAAG